MSKIKTEELVKIANTLQLEPTNEVLSGLEKDAVKIEENLKCLKSINVDNVEPMFRVDDTPISFLREDRPGETLTKEQVIKNAKTKTGDFITIKKVVK